MFSLRTKHILRIVGRQNRQLQIAIDNQILQEEMVCAGSACVCACRRVNGVARGKPQSHRASKGKGSARVVALGHGNSKVALGGVQAPRCGWEPGGCIHLSEVRQDTD